MRMLAEKFNVSAQTIYRNLKKWGVEIRDKKQSAQLSYEEGRMHEPTKGKKRSDETKRKISQKVAKRWEKRTPEEIQKIASKAKENWESVPKKRRDEILALARKAARETIEKGSKMENAVIGGLEKAGYKVIRHYNMLKNEKLEVDIFLPEKGIAIEIDGPSHSLPIWGEDRLLKTRRADLEKNGLINNMGFHIIRVKQSANIVSQHTERTAITETIAKVKEIENDTSPRCVEVEIK